MTFPHERRTILLAVSYDGSAFSGFAAQRGRATVAGALLSGLRHFDPSIDRLRVASRTDAGVHAERQRVAFDTERVMPTRAWVLGVNRYLPDSVAIQSAAVAPDGLDPRRETVLKWYRYLLLGSRLRTPFWAGRAWRVAAVADAEVRERLCDEMAAARGTHRFDAFRSARDRRQHTERSMAHTAVTLLGRAPELVAVDVVGDGFLHNMVRILVGTAVEVGCGRLERGTVARALETGRRSDAGVTAPPHGLYLRWTRLRRYGSGAWPPGTEGPEGTWPPG